MIYAAPEWTSNLEPDPAIEALMAEATLEDKFDVEEYLKGDIDY